jgi:hypothetical protein
MLLLNSIDVERQRIFDKTLSEAVFIIVRVAIGGRGSAIAEQSG